MYYIYHIPDFMYKDGSIGKIGCTYNIDARIQDNKYISKNKFNFWEVLEEYDCIYTASIRERELQKQYGYPVDTKPYWKTIKMATTKGRSKGGKVSGAIVGKRNVKSGQWKQCQKLGGKVSGLKKKQSGELQKMIKANNIPIIQYDKNNNFIKEWISATQASKKLNLTRSSITAVCRGRLKSTGGFIWKYKEG